MKQKIDTYKSFGVRILVSVILIFSVCVFLTTYFTGSSYLKEQQKRVALESEVMSEKSLRIVQGHHIKVLDYMTIHKKLIFHPDSAKALCERISTLDSLFRCVSIEYVKDFFPGRHLYAPYYSLETHTFGDMAEEDSSYYNDNYSLGNAYNITFFNDKKYFKFYQPIFDDDCNYVGNMCLYYSPGNIMNHLENSHFAKSCVIIVDSAGNYVKNDGTNIQISQDKSVNYLDSINLLWGSDTYDDVMSAIRGDNVQIIRETAKLSSIMCITSRKPHFDAVLWEVEIDSAPFRSIIICNAILFLTSFVLLCFIGDINMKSLAKLVRSEEKYETEIQDASMIQREMLPSSPLESPSIDLNALLLPSAAVGGDCYYYYENDGHLYFCIGDVVGKGLSAALYMSKVVSLFHNISQYHSSTNAIAESMNRELCIDNDDMMFVTMFIAILNLRTGDLRYCNAGHENPIFWNGQKSDSPIIVDTYHNPPLGIEQDLSFTESTLHITPGSMMCIYTDGVTEAKNNALNMFGSSNLLKIFSANCQNDAESLNSAIASSVRNFAGKHPQSDDITLLTLKSKSIDYTLTLENTEKETEKLRELFEYLKEFLYCTDMQLMDIRVAIDEVVTNCVNYAYGTGKGLITVQVSNESEDIIFIVKDEGVPFNLLEYDTPDQVDHTVDELPIGGLGIPLIKSTFDNIEYQRRGNSNVLKLRKTIK